MDKNTAFLDYGKWQCGDNRLSLHEPCVMGILNLTPDSFYAGSRCMKAEEVVERAGRMLEDGAAIIDVGAVSTRPGAQQVTEEEELSRMIPVLRSLVRTFPGAVISVDTYRAAVALQAAAEGASIINDVSAGMMDPAMFSAVAKTRLPYVMMHMKGTPADMQDNPVYGNLVNEIRSYFSERLELLSAKGVDKVILDPGYGFGKTLQHNYLLLQHQAEFLDFGLPILAGLSRKSMIYKLLSINPEDSLHATSVANTVALLHGASILRVHDVKEAVEVIRVIKALKAEATGN